MISETLHYIDRCMISVTSAHEMKNSYINLSELQSAAEFGGKKAGGPEDNRLGVIESKKICPTCGHTAISSINVGGCYGHMGYIVLKEPIYNPMFFKVLLDVMKIFCLNCKGFIIKKTSVEKITKENNDAMMRIRLIKAKSKVRQCHTCQTEVNQNINFTVRPKTLEPVIYQNIEEKGQDKKGKEIGIKSVLRFLSEISDGDWKLLMGDVNYRPQDLMFHKYFPISPPHIRPSNKTPGSETPIFHKITPLYVNIINYD